MKLWLPILLLQFPVRGLPKAGQELPSDLAFITRSRKAVQAMNEFLGSDHTDLGEIDNPFLEAENETLQQNKANEAKLEDKLKVNPKFLEGLNTFAFKGYSYNDNCNGWDFNLEDAFLELNYIQVFCSKNGRKKASTSDLAMVTRSKKAEMLLKDLNTKADDGAEYGTYKSIYVPDKVLLNEACGKTVPPNKHPLIPNWAYCTDKGTLDAKKSNANADVAKFYKQIFPSVFEDQELDMTGEKEFHRRWRGVGLI